MFEFIINLFSKKKSHAEGHKKDNFCQIYNEQYRDAYSRLWIKKIQNYYP